MKLDAPFPCSVNRGFSGQEAGMLLLGSCYWLLPFVTDSGPEALAVTIGSLGRIAGMVLAWAKYRFCCFIRPTLDLRT